MKRVETIINAVKLERIKQALVDMNVIWINIYEIKAYGQNESHIERYRSNSYVVDFNEKIKIEVWTNQENKVEQIILLLKKEVENDIYIVEIEEEMDISSNQFHNFLGSIL